MTDGQKTSFGSLRLYIEKADLSDDRVFSNMIKRALTELKMVPGEMADALRIPRDVGARWLNAVTAPAFGRREPVRQFFLKKIADREAAP